MARGKWARCAVCRKATYICAKRGCLKAAAPQPEPLPFCTRCGASVSEGDCPRCGPVPVLVRWKDEGGAGPAISYSAALLAAAAAKSDDSIGRPYGSPPPVGETNHGWMTRAAAQKLAQSLGADFEEC